MLKTTQTNKWAFWLLAMLLGALVGGAISFLTPIKYRAQATVVVDFNIEETWSGLPDNEIFYFLDREARKLEELAWADETLVPILGNTGTKVDDLRNGLLELSHPKDGGWHFFATADTAGMAADLASRWAESFVGQAKTGIEIENKLTLVNQQLESAPNDATLTAEKIMLENQSMGLLAGTNITLSQAQALPVEERGHLGYSILAGSLIGLMLALLWEVFAFGKKRD